MVQGPCLILRVVALFPWSRGPLDLFGVEKTYKLKEQWVKAGKDGTMPGPDDFASIMDTKRYGPEARPKDNPVRVWPEHTMTKNRPTRVLP